MKDFSYQINVQGVNIDRLIQTLISKNVNLKNIKRSSHTEINFNISKKDYQLNEKFFKDFHITIKDVGVKRIKKVALSLIAVWFAVPLIFLFASICSNYIWKIEVNGLSSLSSKELNSILLEKEIKVGAKKQSSEDIEKHLLSHGEFAQVSCYFRGSTLIINISEKLVFKKVEYEPIRAKYNGVILDYTLRKGTINFIKGEFVREGDILVYPFIYDKLGNKVNVEPVCEIEAKIYLSSTITRHEKEVVLKYSGKTKTVTNILFNNKKFHVNKVQPFVFFDRKVYNSYISSVLPFKRQTIVYYELVQEEISNEDNIETNDENIQ